MPPEERAALLEQLNAGRQAIIAEVEGLSDQLARFRPSEGAWSVLDCLEHIALAEAAMFAAVKQQSIAAAAGRNHEDAYLRNSVKRTRRFEAPESMRPLGRHSSVAEALADFVARRDRTIAYIEIVEDDLRERRTVHPVAGEISCRECLALMIGHPLRHAEQIREIKRSAGLTAGS